MPTTAPTTPAITSGISAKPIVNRTQLSNRFEVALNISAGMKIGASAIAMASPILPSAMTMIAAAAIRPPMIQTTIDAMLMLNMLASSARVSEKSNRVVIIASKAVLRLGAPTIPISSAPRAPGVLVTIS